MGSGNGVLFYREVLHASCHSDGQFDCGDAIMDCNTEYTITFLIIDAFRCLKKSIESLFQVDYDLPVHLTTTFDYSTN